MPQDDNWKSTALELSEPIFDQMVQLNVRIPMRTRVRLEQYQEYMELPESERPESTIDWPISLAAIVREALDEWLAEHPKERRRGGRKGEPKPPKVISRITRKEEE